MVEGELSEPISEAKKLMLGDILHFTKAPLESNRTRDYKVVELFLVNETPVSGGTVVEAMTGDKFRYRLTDAKLVELGAEIVYRRMG
jgi:hypothetical protein